MIKTFAATLFFLLAGPTQALADERQPVLVELFTSQGCSSCPRANKILGDLAREPDIVALTFPVTYWDYLGWRDTLARDEFTQRQKNYARAMGLRHVYTPQLIVQGQKHSNGAHLIQVRDTLAKTPRQPQPSLRVLVRGGVATIDLGGDLRRTRPADVWVAQFQPGVVDVAVTRGENSGRRVTHYNAVTGLAQLGAWSGAAARFNAACAPACAVVVQERANGAVIAARTSDIAVETRAQR
jgi:hypothetical protein